MAGRKVFTSGEILTAADVNSFLMDQSVMVFADSTARSSAIPTPTEGMVTYLEDADELEVYTNAWGAVSAPAILQVVSTTKTDAFATTSTSSVSVTGLSATITPSSTDSKVLVMCSLSYGQNNTNTGIRFNLDRSGTFIAQATGGDEQNSFAPFEASANSRAGGSINFLDSPASTSSTTYSIEMFVNSGTGYVNRGENDVRGVSSITLFEVAV